jgi:hypothetical protein
MDTPLKRLASFFAIAVLRGDNRIECGMVTDEHSPVTIEDVISPVPMNPSFISEKAKCIEIRSVLAIVDSGRVVGKPEVIQKRASRNSGLDRHFNCARFDQADF